MKRENNQKIGGLILAGGLGTRMGRINKGLVPLHHKPLIEWVIDAILPSLSYLAISANENIDEYKKLGFPIFSDYPEYQERGPLGGIYSALSQFPNDLDAIQIVPCDTPFLPHDLVDRLHLDLINNPTIDAVMTATQSRSHPTLIQLRPRAYSTLSDYLENRENNSLYAWINQLNHHVHYFKDDAPFANINDFDTLNQYQTEE